MATHALTLAEKRAILASWASDASAIASCPALRAPEGLKAPVTIDEILEALCELDGGPRNPPGGKPMRLRSTERRAGRGVGEPWRSTMRKEGDHMIHAGNGRRVPAPRNCQSSKSSCQEPLTDDPQVIGMTGLPVIYAN